MKQKRNSGAIQLFWAIIILLTLLGLIIKILEYFPITFPEEDSPLSSSITQTTNEPTVNSENTTNLETSVESEKTHENEITSVSTLDSKDESNSTTNTELETTEEPEIEIIPDKPIGTIFLTFDDGPSLEITPQILDILSKNNIKATFFILDYSFESKYEELVIRAFNEGHSIGLHGTSHTYSTIYSSLDALIENFETLQQKVYESTGYLSHIIRFPGGSSNTVSKNYCTGIMTEAVEYFSSTDFVYFDWNVDSQDAGGATSAEEVFENVTSSIKQGRNNIVLMHDSGNKHHTLQALQQIIDWAIAEGYEFQAITEETKPVTHKIAN